jgi:hypothetical protein
MSAFSPWTRLPNISASHSQPCISGATRATDRRRTGLGGTFDSSQGQFPLGSPNTWSAPMVPVERRERLGRNGQVVRRYRVRWSGPDSKQRNKTFHRKIDADRFAATVSADLVRGQSWIRTPATSRSRPTPSNGWQLRHSTSSHGKLSNRGYVSTSILCWASGS